MPAVNEFEPHEVRLGLKVAAPIKRGKRRRSYEDATVTWASTDGRVVQVLTDGKKPVKATFACCSLRRPGTPTPALGVVI